MTTVATQTHWSWLKDLEKIATLTKEHGVEFSMEVGKIQELQDSINLNPDTSANGGIYEKVSVATSDSDQKQASHHKRDEEVKLTNETAGEKTLVLPSIVGAVNSESKDRSKTDLQCAEELILPPLVSVSQVVEMDSQEDDTKSMKAVSLSSIEQLEQMTFPFFDNQTAEDSDTEEASDIIEDDERGSSRSTSSEVSAPRLKLDNLPWPSILQYMRESESLTSEYFSLNNKEAIESRLAHNRRLQQTVTSEEAERLKSHQIMTKCNDSGESESESESTRNEKEGDLMAAKSQTCDFCGQNSTQISLLQLVDEQESHMALCCEEKKEFCVFMAVCMRQMVTRLKQQRPKKISVELTKKAVKKTAEEKALAMMRRQRKWEELRRRKEDIQQQTKLPKHEQLIQFSLNSPEGEWMVRPESAMNHQTPKQKQEALKRERTSKKREQEHLRKGVLLPKTIERLKQCERAPCELKVLNYGDGNKLTIVLPDGTGQVYYPSGNQAITIFSPYSGVLAYLVFEDSSQASLLAYMDELGRITCYSSEANIRLLLRPCEGFLYDGEGCRSCRKRWIWSSGEAPVLQPFTLSLNKQLAVKLNSHEKFLLTFCGSKLNHIKFDVESKLKDDTMLSREIESVQLAQSYLGLVKNRISHLLQLLKQNSRPNVPTRKHSVTEGTLLRSDWQTIYNTKTFTQRGDRSRTTNERAERRRTKSTGGLTLQKSPIKIKSVIS